MASPERLDIFQLRLDALARRRRKQTTIRDNRHVLVRFDRWLRERELDAQSATRLDVEEYFDALLAVYEVASVRRHLACIRAAYRYAKNLGVISLDPSGTVVLPRQPDVEPEVYSRQDLEKVVAAVRDEIDDILVRLLLFNGCRRAECVRLRYADVDRKADRIRVIGKADKLRYVPLHPVLAEVLCAGAEPSAYLLATPTTGRMSIVSLNKRLRAVLERAHVTGGRRPVHAFRRTVATSLYEEGIRESVIDAIMGWSPTSVRGRYYTRISDNQKQDAIRRLYGGNRFFAPPAARAQPQAGVRSVNGSAGRRKRTPPSRPSSGEPGRPYAARGN